MDLAVTTSFRWAATLERHQPAGNPTKKVHHANHPELCHTARGDGRCRGSDRRCTDSRRGECADVRQLGCVGDSVIAGLPYTALRDAVLAHPTMAEGLGGLFSNVPQR